MTILVRPAEPADAGRVRQIHLSAFPCALVAELVEKLSNDGDLVISLIAERGGEAIGHIALSRMRVMGDGRPVRALGLGPIAVERPMQSTGAGSALIEAAKGIAQATGEAFIFVLGEPDYYRRFGFSAATAAPFQSPYSGPYFMALALRPSEGLPGQGQAVYAPAFGRMVQTR